MFKVTVLEKREAANCPIRDVLDRVGDKWSLIIFCVLQDEPKRFNQIRRLVGDITQRVLTSTLRKMEADGYITREVFPTSPPKVIYTLTEHGRQLLLLLEPVIMWAEKNHSLIKASREKYGGTLAVS